MKKTKDNKQIKTTNLVNIKYNSRQLMMILAFVLILVVGVVFTVIGGSSQNSISDNTKLSCAILSPIFVFISIIGIYFLLKKKYPVSFWGEFVALLIVITFSIGTKYSVFAIGNEDFNVSKANAFLLAIYSTFGGLQFEGLPLNEVAEGASLALYYGYSLDLGLIMLMVITFKVSYEIYSKIALAFRFKLFGMINNCNKYVFTDLNNETLQLAKSIKNTQPDSAIVFSGRELRPYDRKDDLCREAMMCGFYYISYKERYSDDKDLNKSICDELFSKGCCSGKYYVFSFNEEKVNDKYFDPTEEENSDFIFKDLERQPKNSKKITEYYLLTKRGVNMYQYQKKFDACIKGNDKCLMYIINEGDLIGRDLVGKLIGKHPNNVNSLFVKEGNLNVWSLGFGEIGKSILKEIYVNAIVVDGHCEFDVFDEKCKDFIGIFKYEHPYYICIDDNLINNSEKESTIGKRKSVLKQAAYEIGENYLKDYFGSNYDKTKYEIYVDDVVKKMQFPYIVYSSINCNSKDFVEKLDLYTGKQNYKKNNLIRPTIITIALGNDYENIKIANALFYDLCGEKTRTNDFKKIQIAVHIRDEKNKPLLSVSTSNISMISFGSNDEIYCFDKIIVLDELKQQVAMYDALHSLKDKKN